MICPLTMFPLTYKAISVDYYEVWSTQHTETSLGPARSPAANLANASWAAGNSTRRLSGIVME